MREIKYTFNDSKLEGTATCKRPSCSVDRSLLAEVSHEEANMRGGRGLCRLLTRFLSRMRWRFLNNQ